ncbi:hypothetical protein [Novosphingobium sp. 9]|uniref:hypothetical protein n=1 Tax=Novosphingobium sp. 9 TaxID=2025349 RepID=UPI0021B5E80F|nr:hypothetical protein [Novosphingobium sp. 9]
MSAYRVVMPLALLAASVTFATPPTAQVLWQHGSDALLTTRCPPGGDIDETCKAIALRHAGQETLIGAGYMTTRVLWSRPPGGAGPDVIVLGDDGGSGGDGDLLAVTFSDSAAPVVKRLRGERIDAAKVTPSPDGPRISLAFDIEYFNGAPHAGAALVPLPLVWRDGDFALDPKALTTRPMRSADLDRRERAVARELTQWTHGTPETQSLYPGPSFSGTPVTVQTLVELMLSGHAKEADALLRRAWPQRAGRQAFWADLCRAVVTQPYWQRFALARLPGADLIAASARAATPST